ncbi:hypothetical protein [Nocardioides sp. zg-1228]|uniref:hypothetical protein n=1 Tax=Nocardioides sp. zg-1228 TaxID=2763008 RepID=UPI0016431815|nr:hypothetical protein [Nocardioides sp. zg-1228]MBC2931651.1 hypothetical protein [Nocardioides sp. zg-1228]QSF57242.1 hypothetical protein JX575_17035 [Nocardioides sp. zg-1228]
MAGLAVSYGWSVVGPARAALSDKDQLAALWLVSIRTRLCALLVVTPPLVILCLASMPEGSRLLGISVALATSLVGFSLTWFAVGTGQPRQLVVFDALPRAFGSVAGASLAAWTGDVLYFPIVFAVSIILPVIAFSWRERRAATTIVRPIVRHGAMVQAAATEVIAGSYTVGASALVGQVTSAATVATFNSGERLTRAGAVAISVTGNSLMGWVARAEGPAFVRRCAVAAAAHAGIGMLGLSVIVVAGPELTGLLFGEFRMAQEDCVWFGCYYLLWSLETVTGRHVLANKHQTRPLLLSTLVGGVFGLVGVPVAAGAIGSTGAVMAMCGAMAIIVLLEVPVAASVLRREWRAAPERRADVNAFRA